MAPPFATCKIVVGEDSPFYSVANSLNTGCSVSVIGDVVESQGKGQRFEIQAKEVELVGTAEPETYPLQKKRHTPEFLREIAHLRPRTNTFGAMARVRNAVAYAIHSFFQERGFQYIQTPIITASDAEGAGSMFRVTTLDLENLPRLDGAIDLSEDFFGRSTYLTVSGQLEAEIFAMALSNVYTFAPHSAPRTPTPRGTWPSSGWWSPRWPSANWKVWQIWLRIF